MRIVLNRIKTGSCSVKDCYKVTVLSDRFHNIQYDLHELPNGKYKLNEAVFKTKDDALDFLRQHFTKVEKVLLEAQLSLKGIVDGS